MRRGFFFEKVWLLSKKALPLHPQNENQTKMLRVVASMEMEVRHMGKSYTASSFGIPPGLDRSKGTRL